MSDTPPSTPPVDVDCPDVARLRARYAADPTEEVLTFLDLNLPIMGGV